MATTIETANAQGFGNIAITIPTGIVLGSADLNIASLDGNADSATQVVTVYVIPGTLTATEFADINSQLCGDTTLIAASLTLTKTGSGYVKWSSIDVNKSTMNFDGNVNFTDTSVQVIPNQGWTSPAGKIAEIQFNNLNSNDISADKADVYWTPNGGFEQLCPGDLCYNFTRNDGSLTFNVDHFSTYTVKKGIGSQASKLAQALNQAGVNPNNASGAPFASAAGNQGKSPLVGIVIAIIVVVIIAAVMLAKTGKKKK